MTRRTRAPEAALKQEGSDGRRKGAVRAKSIERETDRSSQSRVRKGIASSSSSSRRGFFG